MPAWRLDEQDRQVQHFDIGAGDGHVAGFVAHVVLCLAEQPQIVNVRAKVLSTVHMGPPLETKPQSVDVIGTTVLASDGLPPSERRQIKVFVDDRLRERKAQEARLTRLPRLEPYFAEYTIHPPYVLDELTLWLAMNSTDLGFVKRVAAKLTNLVEARDVIRNTGDLVWNPQDTHPEMRYQVIPTISFDLTMVESDAVLDSNHPNKLNHLDRIDNSKDNEDKGEYGLGGNWWAEDTIRRIARDLL